MTLRAQSAEELIPKIPFCASGEPRPLWSVMIPTYQCASYLVETLESVLDQNVPSEFMQIEVVDDCSTDNPEKVVGRYDGRVLFHRQARNVGPTRNFNTCILRGRGELVHILHGDDYVARDFYNQMGDWALRNPGVHLFACRAWIVDERSALQGATGRIPLYETPSRDPAPIFYTNPFVTSSMVMRRTFYEQHGGFDTRLVHTADWEMWARGVVRGGIVMLNQPLAYYRDFPQNHTSQLRRSAQNLRDCLKLSGLFRESFKQFSLARFQRQVNQVAYAQMAGYIQKGDPAAARASREVFSQTTSWRLLGAVLLKEMGWAVYRFLKQAAALLRVVP
jgi:hypothetical protein